MVYNKKTYFPTEDEIAAACAAIREGWSERERISRQVGGEGRVGFEFPVVTGEALGLSFVGAEA